MNDDSSVLRNRLMIANNLAVLAKEKCMLTAALGGKNTLLTSVIMVDQKKGTVILDTSPSEKLNKMCTTLRRVQFSTVFNGIRVAFSGEKITRTKYKGYDVFLMDFPNSLFWFDRRGSYRVRIPTLEPGVLKITVPKPAEHAKPEYIAHFERITSLIRQQLIEQIEKDLMTEQKNFEKAYLRMNSEEQKKARVERQKLEKERQENPPVPDENLINVLDLRLIDLSMTGCALMNNLMDYSYFLTERTIYKDCMLVFPKHGEAIIDFEIVMQRDLSESEEVTVGSRDYEEFIGIKFIEPSQPSESTIFRYIQAMDRLMKNREEFS